MIVRVLARSVDFFFFFFFGGLLFIASVGIGIGIGIGEAGVPIFYLHPNTGVYPDCFSFFLFLFIGVLSLSGDT